MTDSTTRYALVTGANKGIGFAICKELTSKGIIVILTARDEKRGLEATDKLKEGIGSALSDNVIFHQLDVTDPASINSLQEFVQARIGKLDILVNNAGVGGTILDAEALAAAAADIHKGADVDWNRITTEPYELAEECLEINYYGTKRMVDAFIHLLRLSDSPRIVNISSSMGTLEYLRNEWAKQVLRDVETLTEDKLDEVIKKYLKDHKQGSLEKNGWPVYLSAYKVSKVAMNAYTRILALNHPALCVNSVCPGFVKTDINYNTGFSSPEEGAQSPVWLALLPNGGPSGRFFKLKEESSFE